MHRKVASDRHRLSEGKTLAKGPCLLKTSRFTYYLIGNRDFLTAFSGQFDHLIGHAFRHEFVRMILTHQLAVRSFQLRVARTASNA